jgi:hypothetical protein
MQEKRMAGRSLWKLFAAAVLGTLVVSGGARAQSCGNNAGGFEAWKADFAQQAQASGVGRRGLSALANTSYATATIKADRAVHKAFSGSVEDFMRRRGAASIISKGRSLKKSNAALFDKIESQYGVPAGVLLAIWGMETGFGSYMGKQNTVSAIVTLAYDCRRPGFFTPHAIAALKLVDSGSLSGKSVGAIIMARNLLLLPGDGIGPEAMAEVKKIIAAMNEKMDAGFETEEGLVGGSAYDAHGEAISEGHGQGAGRRCGAVRRRRRAEVGQACPMRCARGGPAAAAQGPGLFANLRPAICYPALADASSLKRSWSKASTS